MMLAALAPLLSPGPQMANETPSGRVMPLELTAECIVIEGTMVFPRALRAVTGRSTEPALVWIGLRCGSACESVAIALSDRPRTPLVGAPTAGLTPGNEFIDIGRDLTGYYTAGWMVHADGRRIEGAIPPQVPYEGEDQSALRRLFMP